MDLAGYVVRNEANTDVVCWRIEPKLVDKVGRAPKTIAIAFSTFNFNIGTLVEIYSTRAPVKRSLIGSFTDKPDNMTIDSSVVLLVVRGDGVGYFDMYYQASSDIVSNPSRNMLNALIIVFMIPSVVTSVW